MIKGSKNFSAKLTEAQVREILDDKVSTLAALGKRYGVDQSCIWQIKSGKAWKHVKR